MTAIFVWKTASKPSAGFFLPTADYGPFCRSELNGNHLYTFLNAPFKSLFFSRTALHWVGVSWPYDAHVFYPSCGQTSYQRPLGYRTISNHLSYGAGHCVTALCEYQPVSIQKFSSLHYAMACCIFLHVPAMHGRKKIHQVFAAITMCQLLFDTLELRTASYASLSLPVVSKSEVEEAQPTECISSPAQGVSIHKHTLRWPKKHRPLPQQNTTTTTTTTTTTATTTTNYIEQPTNNNKQQWKIKTTNNTTTTTASTTTTSTTTTTTFWINMQPPVAVWAAWSVQTDGANWNRWLVMKGFQKSCSKTYDLAW